MGFARGEMETGRSLREAQEVLDSEVRWMEGSGAGVTEPYCRTADNSAEPVVKLAEEIDASLIVVGSRELTAIKRVVLGSVSDSIVRYAHCPVLEVPEED